MMALILSPPKPKQQSALNALEDIPEVSQKKSILDALAIMSENGTELDTIPEGFGEFGHTVTNPIPLKTTFGSIVYLRKLTTITGKRVEFERLGSTKAENIRNIIDAYKISIEGKKIATLFISPYHKKNSERAPKGFKLS